jgi:hypothetical protein
MKHPEIYRTVWNFCKFMQITMEQPEENIYQLENYILYCPGSNSIDAEALTDFRVFRSVVIPGRHTLSNGDPGYPDEYDEQEVSRHPAVLSALEKIGHLMVTDWTDQEVLVVDDEESRQMMSDVREALQAGNPESLIGMPYNLTIKRPE